MTEFIDEVLGCTPHLESAIRSDWAGRSIAEGTQIGQPLANTVLAETRDGPVRAIGAAALPTHERRVIRLDWDASASVRRHRIQGHDNPRIASHRKGIR